MAKQKKKRNKTYSGVDAAMTRPVITRISAVNRSKTGQWWFENKKRLKPILIATAVVLFIIVLIIQIIYISGS